MKFFFLLLILASLVSCKQETGGENILRTMISSDISGFDPAICFDTSCGEIVYQVYDTLYEYDYRERPYRLRPLLALDMPKIENDGLRYIIKIKKNVQYHPHSSLAVNRTLTAQDIITQIKRVAYSPTLSNGWWLFEHRVKGLDEWRERVGISQERFFSEKNPEGLSAPDEHTLVIDLKQKFPQLIYALGMSFTAPVPEEAVKALKNDLIREEIGTGPYIIKDFNFSQKVVLEKFKNYHSPINPISGLPLDGAEKVIVSIMKEQQTAWLSFVAKKLDLLKLAKDNYQLALNTNGTLRSDLEKDHVQFQKEPTMIYWWLSFNMNDPIIGKNLNLRKAIAHGIDMDKYLQVFTYGLAKKANSIYTPGIAGYDEKAETPYKYDLEKAKNFMALAGYPEGKGLPPINYDVRGYSTMYRQMAEFIQNDLAKIGVKIQISTNTFPKFLEKSRRGHLQFWQGGWVMDYPDAENTVQLLTKNSFPPGPNTSNYTNPKVEALYSKLKFMDDGPEKYKIMSEIEQIVHQDIPWIMQYYTTNVVLAHPWVENYFYSDIIRNFYKYIKVNKH